MSAAAVGAAAYILRPGCDGALPSFAATRAAYEGSDARLYDRHGTLIHELRVDFSGRRSGWAPLADISPALINAVVVSEDRRFYSHKGVDWLALARSAADNLLTGKQRGASTITMQMTSMLPGGLPRKGRRSVYQKAAQIRMARAIERAWSKQEVMEAYLNLVSFRGELAGVSAASRGLFGKGPDGLDTAESVVLASLIRAPNAGGDAVHRRATALAAAMGETVPEGDIRSAAALLAGGYTIAPVAALAPHVARMLLSKGAREVTSTLDAGLQRYATELAAHCVSELKSANVSDCAILVADNKTGEVLAYVGNPGAASSAMFVDGVRARRQAGSTLKPFLYALAFEKRLITPASLLDDSPMDVPTAVGVYSPEDYDRSYRGIVTARTALASSLNIPAVRVLALISEEPFKDRLSALGVTGLRDGEYYGLSLALGSAEVSLWELVGAYRTLANGGVRSGLSLIPGQPQDTKRVCTPQAAYLVSCILSDREARASTFGLENPLATRSWSAVKTGTSKDMRDNWCVGYSARYTVGVWVGNFSGEPMWDVSGITGAAPVWAELMARLNYGEASPQPRPPAGIVKTDVEFADSGARRPEWFIRGTEPVSVRVAARAPSQKIQYPPDGTIIALDPDIPATVQRVFFESSVDCEAARWVLDGATLAGSGAPSWSPVTGAHTLVLTTKAGEELDKVSFSVR